MADEMTTDTVGRNVVETSRRWRWPLPSGAGLLALPGVLLLGVIFVYPLVKLIADSVTTSQGLSLARYAELLTSGAFIDVITRTIRISGLVTLFAVLIGYPVAYLASRVNKYVAFILIACVVLPLFTSTLVRSYAWRVILADNGIVNDTLLAWGLTESPAKMLYNDTSLLIGMTQVLLPLAILPILASLKSIDRSLVEAAHSAGASPLTSWRTITLPLSFKGVAAGASLVFITSLGFYTTPALLGGVDTPMFAQLVDSQVNNQADYGSTTAGATLVLIGVVVLMLLLRRPLGLMGNPETVSPSRPRRWSAPSWRAGRVVLMRIEEVISPLRWILLTPVAVYGLVLLVAPQIVVALLAFNDASFLSFPPEEYSVRWFDEYFANGNWMDSTLLSAKVSAIAAAIATLFGTMAAFAVVRMKSRRVSTGVYLLSLTPMVLPPILYAVGLFFMFVPLNLVGSETALVVAYIALGIPFVMITSQAVARDIDPLVERAAASMGAGVVRRAVGIIVPLMLPALIASFLLAFIQVFDDLVLALFLGGPANVTLQMRMYEDIQFEISPMVAAVGVLLTLVTLLASLAILTVGRRRASQIDGPAPS